MGAHIAGFAHPVSGCTQFLFETNVHVGENSQIPSPCGQSQRFSIPWIMRYNMEKYMN